MTTYFIALDFNSTVVAIFWNSIDCDYFAVTSGRYYGYFVAKPKWWNRPPKIGRPYCGRLIARFYAK